MPRLFRTATMALLSVTAVAALSAANGAMNESIPSSTYELPASVFEEAQVETELTIIPDVKEPESQIRAATLPEMVADHLSSQTASQDEECLAVAVYFESRSEPLAGQLTVAHTVINRAKSGRFPASLCGVVKQPSQFSFVRGGGFPAFSRSSRDWREAVAIAKIATQEKWESSAKGALFFHAARVSPGWKLKRIASVGNHVFYR
jgi:N-acetylmuramoyl-L-alanine amidase